MAYKPLTDLDHANEALRLSKESNSRARSQLAEADKRIAELTRENARLRDAERIAWAKMHMGWDIEMGHPPEGFRYYLTNKIKGIAVLIGPDYWQWSSEARAAIDAAKEST